MNKPVRIAGLRKQKLQTMKGLNTNIFNPFRVVWKKNIAILLKTNIQMNIFGEILYFRL
jgi:hypothetical protein